MAVKVPHDLRTVWLNYLTSSLINFSWSSFICKVLNCIIMIIFSITNVPLKKQTDHQWLQIHHLQVINQLVNLGLVEDRKMLHKKRTKENKRKKQKNNGFIVVIKSCLEVLCVWDIVPCTRLYGVRIVDKLHLLIFEQGWTAIVTYC